MVLDNREELEEELLCPTEGQVDRDRPRRVGDVVWGERRYDDFGHGAVSGIGAVLSKPKGTSVERNALDWVVTRGLQGKLGSVKFVK